MAWANKDKMRGIIRAIKPRLNSTSNRIEFYKEVLNHFIGCDVRDVWNMYERCVGIDFAFDRALKELKPDIDWEKLEQEGRLAKEEQECP